MKKWIVVLISMFFLSGCGWIYGMGGNSEFDISGGNLEMPEFEFTNQDGEPFGKSNLEGDYWLATMIFTQCPSVCPTMTPNMQRLQDAMIAEGKEMKFISFTVDPKQDTPEVLHKYGTNVGADFNYWNFLTGYSQEEIGDLSKEAFAAIVQDVEDSDEIMHSTSFYLVDPEGNVIRKYDGLQSDQTEIVKDLKATVN
ncbi:SCO family protein [Alkalihalophilus pseudofirmus]|uniref:SCO family protein n=1 Tax=Alkalihalophilus TaxID=2893060 RepID=UPI0009519352|nr:SCO family protein [Alkalihalophilus marmarensis]MED1600997.1 SCO family protein [Alkalihalophilus marmarensis]OLS39532.1 SCO family protein [Alkalihalophilus pseudofirmus]